MQIITNSNGSPKVKIEDVYQINIYTYVSMNGKKVNLNSFQTHMWFGELNQYKCFKARYDHLNLSVRIMNSQCIFLVKKQVLNYDI